MGDTDALGVLEPEMMTGKRCDVCPGDPENGVRTNRKWKRRDKLTSNGHPGSYIFILWREPCNLKHRRSVMTIMAKAIQILRMRVYTSHSDRYNQYNMKKT